MNLQQLLPAGELVEFEHAIHRYGSRCVRKHIDRLDASLPFETSPVPWCEAGQFLEDSAVRPAAFLQYATADYYIQDAASLLPLTLLDIQPDDIVCDLCAAPGGKASAIAERLGPQGALLANESIRSRLDILKYALARTGNPTYSVCSYDPDDLCEHVANQFDAVLVDAPCSGQTLVGKNKRDDNAFADNQIEHCVLRQRRILRAAIRMLKPGGRLVYSTCTFAIEENEAQIQWLMDEHPGCWQPMEPVQLAPWRSPIAPGCFRIWPHRDRCAGGFAAGLRLIHPLDEGSRDAKASSLKPGKASKGGGSMRKGHASKTNQRIEEAKRNLGREIAEELGRYSHLEIEWDGGTATSWTQGLASLRANAPRLQHCPASLLIQSGTQWIPSQALAMLQSLYFAPHRREELSSELAASYVAGNAIPRIAATTGTASTWSIASWQGKSLGWFKAANNRWNNHLPPWARMNIDHNEA